MNRATNPGTENGQRATNHAGGSMSEEYNDFQRGRHAERKRTFELISQLRSLYGPDAERCLDRLVMEIVGKPLVARPRIEPGTRNHTTSEELS